MNCDERITDEHLRVVHQIFDELKKTAVYENMAACPRSILELICLLQKLSLARHQQDSALGMMQTRQALNQLEKALFENKLLYQKLDCLREQNETLTALLTSEPHTKH